MRTGFPLFILIILCILIIIDLYAFRGIRLLTNTFQPWAQCTINILYWIVPLILAFLIIFAASHMDQSTTRRGYRVFFLIVGLLFAAYIPKIIFIVFQLFTDIMHISGSVMQKYLHGDNKASEIALFLTRTKLVTGLGIVIAIIPFVFVIHGITWGRFNYKVKNVSLVSDVLPVSFEGFKILQISDWHIGSFIGHEEEVQKAVDIINSQNADLIVFTGDFVNNIADELKDFVPLLKQIKAPYGLYSVLGNHDYGEYVSWNNKEEHAENMNRLFRYEEEAGFRLLKNESVIIRKGKDSIGLGGVENWGMPPFPQYGKLSQALEDIKNIPYKILLSHDPSHWDAEILNKTDVFITLSGHTHGFQLGINLPWFKWSPAKWKYPRWGGLYNEDKQYLYVNVGIGYLAFPGRVGFMPEITVFELHH